MTQSGHCISELFARDIDARFFSLYANKKSFRPDRYRRSSGGGSHFRADGPRRKARWIGSESPDGLLRWKLQKCDESRIQRSSLQRFHIAAACQILATMFVHEIVDRRGIIRHPLIVGNLDVCDHIYCHRLAPCGWSSIRARPTFVESQCPFSDNRPGRWRICLRVDEAWFVLAGRFCNVGARQMNQASAMTDGNNAARYATKKRISIALSER
jgi:hypothetical protein